MHIVAERIRLLRPSLAHSTIFYVHRVAEGNQGCVNLLWASEHRANNAPYRMLQIEPFRLDNSAQGQHKLSNSADARTTLAPDSWPNTHKRHHYVLGTF